MSEPPSSVEEALELFLAQRRRDGAGDPTAFAARHPELGPELREALESLLALERLTGEREGLQLPERIGPYRVVREIGRGGMGVVLEAVEEPLGRRVALKVILPELLASASARARFRREAELAARLDHPGIAAVYGVGIEADRPWIAMRFVQGRSLARSIVAARAAGARCVRLEGAGSPRSDVLALAACLGRVARTLEAAHAEGVVHRDVKPSNVVVAPDGAPVLLDFGLAILEESDGRTLTRTGDTAGTPAYLSPEIVEGERVRPDAQSDVYALGVTLFECLSLRRPFQAPTPAALYHAIVAGAPPDLRALNRDVPRDLAVVVATAMERDRARRYASAAALAQDLEACVAGRPIAARPVPLAGRVLRWARREPRQAVLATALGVATLAAAVSAGTWWQSRSTVRAAERLTTAEGYERALQVGFGQLATNWLPEADLAFREALALVPDSPEAFAGHALVRMKQHRDAEAAASLAGAPSTPAFEALRSLALGLVPEVEQPREWFATAPAIEMFIDGMRLMKQLERAPRADRQRIAAIAVSRFDEAVERSRTARLLYHVERTLAARAAGDEEAIRSAAAALVALWPEQERALFTAGTALYAVDPHAALPLLERAVAIDPGWGAPHQVLGNTLMATGEFERAEWALRRAIELDPRDADAFNSLGLVLQELDCPAEAREAYLGALALRPMFETWANLGLLDARGTDAVAAERELRTALAYAPYENLLRIPLAELLHRLGRVREAVAELETAVGFDPGDAGAWDLYALWQAELGEDRAAALAGELLRELSASR